MKKIILIFLSIFYGVGIFAQQPVTSRQLIDAKQHFETSENGETAYSFLLRNADKELKKILKPVTEKKLVAGSGDKHDYVSMGPYWWPDTAKSDGLPYIRKDGQRNPEINNLDRYKLDDLSKNISTLSYAYFFSGEEKYAIQAVKNLQMWFLDKKTRMNPNLEYGQMIPGHNNGEGRAEGIIDTYCFAEMVNCINLLSSSRALNKEDYAALKQWFSDYLDWLLASKIGSDERNAENNHGLAYDVQVTAYALFTGRKDVADKVIADFAESRLFKQIEPDGSQPQELARTIALHYSLFNIEHAMDMCDLAKSVGVDLYHSTSPNGRSLNKAIEFISIYLGKPQSYFPYQQIKEWNLNQEKLCWTLKRSTTFQPNADYQKLFDKYCKTKETDIRWLFYTQ